MVEPKGVEFYNVKSDDTHYARSQAQIQAYLNSSDMGVNASRGQDYGWKLGAEWVKKVRAFRKDDTKMSILVAKNNGQNPSTPQILYAIYGEELRRASAIRDEQDAPYEEKYRKAISEAPEPSKTEQKLSR
jgi:hypothetical protein